MKRYIIPLLILAALGACHSDDPDPITPDPFLGDWALQSQGDLQIKFTVRKYESEYQFSNIIVGYSDIPDDAVYTMEVYDGFTDNDGFGRIRINGKWSVSPCETMFCDKWVSINLFNNSIHGTKSYAMNVREMTIDYINRETVDLNDQVFARTP